MNNLKQGFDEKLEQMMKGFEALLSVRMLPQTSGAGSSSSQNGSVLGPFDTGHKNDKADNIFKTIKFEFPKFDGQNHRTWICKCNKLFSHHVVAESQKLYLATMNLEGEAEEWYSGFVQEGQELTWEGLVEEIMARFSPKAQVNPIGELKKLHQLGTVDEYRKKFEELRSWALARNPSLNEAFFIDCFMVRLGIQELKLTTLKDIIRLARVEEAKLEAWLQRSRMSNKPVGLGELQKSSPGVLTKIANGGGLMGHSNTGQPNLESNRNLPIKGLTREQIA